MVGSAVGRPVCSEVCVVLVLVVNSTVGDVIPLIAENSWLGRCWWRGPVPVRHRDHNVHKAGGLRRRENPWAGICWGETGHTQASSKSEEGLELLLSNMDFSMVHVLDDSQDVVVLEIQG